MSGHIDPNLPEVVFRGVLPSEALLALVHEQDALLREVAVTLPHARRAVIMQQVERATHRVEVAGTLHGAELVGQAEHVSPAVALQRAYSELLRRSHTAAPLAA